MRRALHLILPTLLVALAPSAAAPLSPSTAVQSADTIRALDLRFATIGYRLTTANAPLCTERQPGTGLLIHTLAQYTPATREDARRLFRFRTGAAIEAIVPGSPAQAAGLREDDSLISIAGMDVSGVPDGNAKATTDRLVEIDRHIAALPPEAPIAVEALRGDARISATIHPIAACRTRFELKFDDDIEGEADGEVVKMTSVLLERYGDEGMAVLAAHELAHNILRHRVRLDSAGVSRGLAAGFGRNVKYFRQTEVEADLMSVYLLANAGYPADAPVRLWKKLGPELGNFLRLRTHPNWRDRLATIERESERLAADPGRPVIPALLARRDQPLDGDWQSILVRHR